MALRRRFLNSFVVYILPIVVVASLTFATLMMMTRDPNKESRLGIDTSGVIGVCSGLFFIVLLSQVQIREQFAETNIVYVEYFYPIMYIALLGVSVNSYLFALPNDGQNRILNWVHEADNAHPKLMFWPLLLGSTTVITACALLPEKTNRVNSVTQSEQHYTLQGEHQEPDASEAHLCAFQNVLEQPAAALKRSPATDDFAPLLVKRTETDVLREGSICL